MAETKYEIVTGTVEEARALIGTSPAPQQGGIAVDEALIKLLCGAIRDGNPRYWQQGECPPGMLYTWIQDLPWTPNQPYRRVLAVRIPLPGTAVANAGQKIEFHDTIRVGDRLTSVETLESISEEKKTPLGVGHFVVTRAEITKENGDPVATVINTLFRYQPR